jgi:hypothetical protein
MAIFPRIQSPCPVQGNLAAFMDGDMCRLCKRQVFDLSAMDDSGRVAFFANCKTDAVCVSYKIPARLAAAALAASVVALPAAAAPGPNDEIVVTAPDIETVDDIVVLAGGIKDPKNVEFVEDKADAALPELPVTVEPAPAQPAR